MIIRRSLGPTVSTINTMATSRAARMVMEKAKAESMLITPTEQLAIKVRDTTSGWTMLGTNGARTTTGTLKRLSITSGATTQARST